MKLVHILGAFLLIKALHAQTNAQTTPNKVERDETEKPTTKSPEEKAVEEAEKVEGVDEFGDSEKKGNATQPELKPIVFTDPPNEWGSYFSLVGKKLNDKGAMFTVTWSVYKNDDDKKTECKMATFNRWYESSKDKDTFILSYFCMTSGMFGYEHLKVKRDRVVEFQDSLRGFGIQDAGEYSESQSLTGEAAEEIQEELLGSVKAEVEALKDDSNKTICPGAGTQTLYSVQRKEENELAYHRFPISCNITSGSDGHSHMTHIEIAQDVKRVKLYGGKRHLVSMEEPQRNTEFIEKKRIAMGKQGHGAIARCSIAALLFVPILKMLL